MTEENKNADAVRLQVAYGILVGLVSADPYASKDTLVDKSVSLADKLIAKLDD